jgi:hypothetical protein
MKINILNLITFLTFSILFVACEKNETIYPQIYERGSITTGEFTLSTKDSKTKNADSIKMFISNFDEILSEINIKPSPFESETLIYDNYNFKLEILSDTKARLIYNNDSIVNLYTETKNGIFYLSTLDTIKTYTYWSADFLTCEPLFKKINPILPMQSVPLTIYSKCLYAYKIKDEIHFPIVSYKRLKRIKSGGIQFMGEIGVNNIISPDYLSNIGKDNLPDSIVFRQSYIVFKETNVIKTP